MKLTHLLSSAALFAVVFALPQTAGATANVPSSKAVLTGQILQARANADAMIVLAKGGSDDSGGDDSRSRDDRSDDDHDDDDDHGRGHDRKDDSSGRGRGRDESGSGRSRPRIPGGSGCDDANDIAEHASCRP